LLQRLFEVDCVDPHWIIAALVGIAGTFQRISREGDASLRTAFTRFGYFGKIRTSKSDGSETPRLKKLSLERSDRRIRNPASQLLVTRGSFSNFSLKCRMESIAFLVLETSEASCPLRVEGMVSPVGDVLLTHGSQISRE
jgi:hypothetical protein